MKSLLQLLLLLLLLSCLAPISQATRTIPSYPSHQPIKAVNLGGWLVTEGWIAPYLFDNIPVNKDLLDGTQIQLKSVTQNNYLSAINGGGSNVLANQPTASNCETFKLWRITETTFQFRVLNWQFFGIDGRGNLEATSTSSDDSNGSHTFEIVRKNHGTNLTRIRAPNGSFLKVNSDASVTADHPNNTNWGYDDPSVFVMILQGGQLQGEFQVTNAYGPDKAKSVMTDHWKKFIVEDDFKFISQNGLTAVRIPVGWWIRYENPPLPFVGGSLQTLDNAISWAEKYNLKVVIDLHAAPGSQNGWEHSASRDGSQSWGINEDTVDQAVDVIGFLASRYAKRTGFYAIELINEPLAPGVTLDTLMKYYKAGHAAVRKHSDAFVIMSSRLEISLIDPKELIQFASNLSGSVIDVHYYNQFSSLFKGMTAQQNIDYVYHERASALSSLMVSNGPLIFIGEWVVDMDAIGNVTIHDYERFGSAQLDVYGRATFGWSYWSLKTSVNLWNLEWMIKNGYIKV